jgi:hypothetical protein
MGGRVRRETGMRYEEKVLGGEGVPARGVAEPEVVARRSANRVAIRLGVRGLQTRQPLEFMLAD